MKKLILLALSLLVVCCGNDSNKNQEIVKKSNEFAEMGEYPGPKDTPQKFKKSYVEKLIAPHIRKAKQTLPKAKKKFLEGLPHGYSFFVTVDLRSNSGDKENAFIEVERWDNNKITGILSTKLQLVKEYQFGQRLIVSEDNVIDWTITSPDGKEEGNFIGKFLDSYYEKQDSQ